MPDPLAQVIGLLQPSASFSKLVTASGRWAVRPQGLGPFYGAVLDGTCELAILGREPARLARGDFMLMPSADGFIVRSLTPPTGGQMTEPIMVRPGVFHHGEPCPPDTRILVGHCAFGSNDAALLVSLLPELVVVRGERRLTTLVELLGEEARDDRPGRDVVLAHLLEVLLIEAFRATTGQPPRPAFCEALLTNVSRQRCAAYMTSRPARGRLVN